MTQEFNPNLKHLAEVLQSGKYKRATGMLSRVFNGNKVADGAEPVVGHCCLGVAMCEYVAAFPDDDLATTKIQSAGSGGHQLAYGADSIEGLPPYEVQSWLGLRNNAGVFYKSDIPENDPLKHRIETASLASLAALNDDGVSHPAIGRFIERNWQVLQAGVFA